MRVLWVRSVVNCWETEETGQAGGSSSSVGRSTVDDEWTEFHSVRDAENGQLRYFVARGHL